MDDKKRITFRHKNSTACPVCSHEFHREEMLSGGGRLIAGNLTDELRRSYEVSKKYGVVIPLIYILTVCPNCFYTSNQKDFENLLPNEIETLRNLTPARKNAVKKFFGTISFNDDRNLMMGAASYMLNIDCYGVRNKKIAPTFKSAVSAIRAAWLFMDLAKEMPDRPYKKLAYFFYKKAYVFYVRVVDLIQSGEEPSDAAGNMGPDTDKNWGYEGILYMTAMLTVKIGSREPDIHKRIENFEKCKRYLSRLFGMGKSSKSRPSDLLDKTKDLYETINESLEEWMQQVAE